MPTSVTLITDGACSGNGTDASRGGWAAILVWDGKETVLTGAEMPSTNNRMELTAALEGLRAAPAGSDVELVTDSSYLADAIRKRWLEGWQKRGWRTAAKGTVANRDLWERMIQEIARHHAVRPTLVRGHAGHALNERADQLAQDAALTAVPRPREPAPEPAAPPPRPGDQLGFDVG
ncbi:MAG: ribonuclease [Miltoncostaeaceae bacterium]|jgi:ribonuclease HI|nr:ribonuclease [Miltoncostaeaceae bacterium]